MAAERFWLTREDRDELLEGLRFLRSLKNDRPQTNRTPPEISQSPETYVAYINPDGIPALSRGGETGTGTGSHLEDDVPGHARCDVYQAVPDGSGGYLMRGTGFSQEVLNFSFSAVAGACWKPITRDKYGRWMVLEQGGGAGADCCECDTEFVAAGDLISGLPQDTYTPEVMVQAGLLTILALKHDGDLGGGNTVTAPGWNVLYFDDINWVAYRIWEEGESVTPLTLPGGYQFTSASHVSYTNAGVEAYDDSSGTSGSAVAPALTSGGPNRILFNVIFQGSSSVTPPVGVDEVGFVNPFSSVDPVIYEDLVGGGDTGTRTYSLSASASWVTVSVLAITGDAEPVSGTDVLGNVYLCGRLVSIGQGGEGGGPVDWDDVFNTPTTLAGYGITDAASDAELAAHAADTTGIHGITDTADLALKSGHLGQFSATTSAQLAGVISDETGSGVLVFSGSPALTGTPTAPTAAPGTNNTQVATTAYVDAAVAAGGGGVPTQITVADTEDTTCFVALFESATGNLAPKTDEDLTYNASTGVLTCPSFVGDLGGNADTATEVTIGTAGAGTHFVLLSPNTGTEETPVTDNGLTFDTGSNTLMTTTFSGALSGNATTATALQTARTIGGVSFDGTANIVPQTIESANEATDTTCFPLFITASGTQSLQPKNNTAFTFNSNTAALGITSIELGHASDTTLSRSAAGVLAVEGVNVVLSSRSISTTAPLTGGGDLSANRTLDISNFVAAGGSAAKGTVPAPGATSHSNFPYYIGDDGNWRQMYGRLLGVSNVTTDQTTNSASFVDLTTAQSITFSLDETSNVLVLGFVNLYSTTGAVNAAIAVDVDGSDTQLGDTTTSAANQTLGLAGGARITGLSSGSHTFKLQFATGGGVTAHFRWRTIAVYLVP